MQVHAKVAKKTQRPQRECMEEPHHSSNRFTIYGLSYSAEERKGASLRYCCKKSLRLLRPSLRSLRSAFLRFAFRSATGFNTAQFFKNHPRNKNLCYEKNIKPYR